MDNTISLTIRCARCGEQKAPQAFGRDESRPRKLNPYCRVCRQQIARDYRNSRKDFVA